jgi:hypothetical protein
MMILVYVGGKSQMQIAFPLNQLSESQTYKFFMII